MVLAVTYPWASASSYLSSQSVAFLIPPEKKKERKQTTQGRDGRTVHRHHTGISRRGQCGASRHLPLGACLFLSLFAVCRRFSLQPSCHPAVFLLSSFSLLSLLPLSRRSPLPRSAAPPPPVGPLLSRLLLPLGAVPLSSLRIVAPQVYPAHLSRKERKKTDNPREGWEDGTPPPHRDFLRRGECGASRRPP